MPSDAGRTGDYTSDYRTTSNAGTGGLDWATFMLGDVTQVSRYVSTSLTAAERQWRMFYYGQDTWRLTSKLTLNYGLRWEVYFHEYVNGKGNGGFANIVQGIDRVAGYGPYGLNGNIPNDWRYFAPRVGFAYQLREKTVLRMGYGRSYDMGVLGSNFGQTATQALPVLAAQLAVGASQNFPAFTRGHRFSFFQLSQQTEHFPWRGRTVTKTRSSLEAKTRSSAYSRISVRLSSASLNSMLGTPRFNISSPIR